LEELPKATALSQACICKEENDGDSVIMPCCKEEFHKPCLEPYWLCTLSGFEYHCPSCCKDYTDTILNFPLNVQQVVQEQQQEMVAIQAKAADNQEEVKVEQQAEKDPSTDAEKDKNEEADDKVKS